MIMLSDYKISQDYPENVISDITLALFEDSWWYEVNYYTGRIFRFVKSQDYRFLKSKCINEEGESNFVILLE